MKTKLYLISTFILLYACNSISNTEIIIQEEVNTANTVDKQKAYLIAIKKGFKKSKMQFFQNKKRLRDQTSAEYKIAKREYESKFQKYLDKVETYLSTHGHPTKDIHGKKAAETPYLIIYQYTNFEDADKYAKYLYEANQFGDCKIEYLNFYLHNLYAHRFDNQRIEWDRPYRPEEELDTLIKSLDLMEMAKEVIQKNKNK